MLGIYLFDKQNVSIVVVFDIPHVVTFFPCQRLDQLSPRLIFFFFFKQNAVPDERRAVMGSLKKGSHDVPLYSLQLRQRFQIGSQPPHILAIGVKLPL